MPRFLVLSLTLFSLLVISGCKEKVPTEEDVILTRVKDNVYIHTTYGRFGENIYPANGLLYLTGEGALLVDTPWTDGQTEKLVSLVDRKFNSEVKLVIATHYHHDNMGGLNYLNSAGIKLITTPLTKGLAAEKSGLEVEHAEIDSDIWTYELGGRTIEVYYPGPAHTVDNITVWLAAEKVLFGGCAVKPMSAKGKGNVAEADLQSWPDSMMNLYKRYREAETVVPGHGAAGGPSLLLHTYELIKRG